MIYQIYPRSFADGNGDGIGDFTGIRERLPYLAELGVDGIWLNPFYPSPGHDQGYDISDYTSIDPEYGTLDDFRDFLRAAHDLGIRVIVDIVANHCSIDHPLFRAAVEAGEESPERARFHFARGRGADGEEPPNNWRSMFGGPAWSRLPDGEWYLHLFTAEQPDFNWRNPATIEFFDDVLRFWLDLGVDGFRLDAAQGLFKNAELPDVADPYEEERVGDATNPFAWNQPEVHDVYRHWRALVDEYAARDGIERPLVVEITGIGALSLAEYVGNDQLHDGFFFEFMKVDWNVELMRETIDRGLRQAESTVSPVTWVLGNHDTVRVATRYAGGAPGVSRGDEQLGEKRALAATLLTLALPGSAYLFAGDELGLPEVTDLPIDALRDPIFRNTNGERRGRDGCRVPLPWSGEAAPFGFSRAESTWLPQPAYFAGRTVADRMANADSGWQTVRSALRVRRELLENEAGEYRKRDVHPDAIAFDRGDRFTCVVNLGTDPIESPFAAPPTVSSLAVWNGMIPASATCWWVHDAHNSATKG